MVRDVRSDVGRVRFVRRIAASLLEDVWSTVSEALATDLNGEAYTDGSVSCRKPN